MALVVCCGTYPGNDMIYRPKLVKQHLLSQEKFSLKMKEKKDIESGKENWKQLKIKQSDTNGEGFKKLF